MILESDIKKKNNLKLIYAKSWFNWLWKYC